MYLLLELIQGAFWIYQNVSKIVKIVHSAFIMTFLKEKFCQNDSSKDFCQGKKQCFRVAFGSGKKYLSKQKQKEPIIHFLVLKIKF